MSGVSSRFIGHSLAIVHVEMLVAPLQPVAVVVAGAAVAPALAVVLQDLLEAARTGAAQYGGPHRHRLAVVGHGRVLVVARPLDAVALRVVHKCPLLDDAAVLGALHLRVISGVRKMENGKREIRK